MKSVVTALAISCFTIIHIHGHAAQNINVVKKSSSGICHDVDSRWYSKLKSFKAYATIEACLAKGGRTYSGYRAMNTVEIFFRTGSTMTKIAKTHGLRF